MPSEQMDFFKKLEEKALTERAKNAISHPEKEPPFPTLTEEERKEYVVFDESKKDEQAEHRLHRKTEGPNGNPVSELDAEDRWQRREGRDWDL